MIMGKFIKRLIPGWAKRYIKNIIGVPEVSSNRSSEYIIKTSDINKLAGKKVIVTGGTGAIGTAICQRLYLEGAIIGICGRNEDKLDSVLKRIREQSIECEGKLIPLVMDVTDDESIYRAIDEFISFTGGIDVFINNAGGGARGNSKPIYEQDIKIIDQVLQTNLRGSIICARRAAQVMIEKKQGKIINMSSVVGMCGKATMTDYATAKAGIIGFTKSLALELGEFGITVNCISPGMVNQVPFDAGMPERPTKSNCLKRFGYTDEVANLVEFIISDESDYITGHNFVVDGGRSLGLMGD